MAARLSPLERRAATATEDDALCFWLGDKKHFGFAQAHGGRGFHIRKAKGQNVTGFPDVLMQLPFRRLVRDGEPSELTVAIEIKIADDTLRPEQREVLDRFERAGALAMVVRYGRLRPGEVDQDQAVKMIEERLKG